MYIQKRAYKFNSSGKDIKDIMTKVNNLSHLNGRWVDENNFYLQKKPFPFFKLFGNIDEVESNNKLKISIAADYRYLLLYILPAAVIAYGLYQWPENSEKGLLLVLAGISLFGFIFLIGSTIIDNLKKNFKEEFRIT
jgi:hypothetical protein